MAAERYSVSARDLQELVVQLNVILGRIAERLDAIEGIHGDFENRSEIKVLDSSETVVSGFLNE